MKQKILQLIVEKLEGDLSLLTRAAVEAREAATHSESKQEDKYDTRGLEASYLAGAQAKRAFEIQKLIEFFRRLSTREFNSTDPIASTALVTLKNGTTETQYFLVPEGGGFSVVYNGQKIQILSCTSPLATQLIGRTQGEELTLPGPSKTREVEILRVA